MILDELAIFLKALFEKTIFAVVGILLFNFLGVFGVIGFLMFILTCDWIDVRRKFYKK